MDSSHTKDIKLELVFLFQFANYSYMDIVLCVVSLFVF